MIPSSTSTTASTTSSTTVTSSAISAFTGALASSSSSSLVTLHREPTKIGDSILQASELKRICKNNGWDYGHYVMSNFSQVADRKMVSIPEQRSRADVGQEIVQWDPVAKKLVYPTLLLVKDEHGELRKVLEGTSLTKVESASDESASLVSAADLPSTSQSSVSIAPPSVSSDRQSKPLPLPFLSSSSSSVSSRPEPFTPSADLLSAFATDSMSTLSIASSVPSVSPNTNQQARIPQPPLFNTSQAPVTTSSMSSALVVTPSTASAEAPAVDRSTKKVRGKPLFEPPK